MSVKARQVDSEWTCVHVGDITLRYNMFNSATGCALTAVYTSQQLERLEVGWALTAITVTNPTKFEHMVAIGVHTDFAAVKRMIKAHPLNPAILVSGEKQLDVYRLDLNGVAYTAAALTHLRTDVYNVLSKKTSNASRTVPEYYSRIVYVPAVYAAAERVLHFLWPEWRRIAWNYRAVAELSGCDEKDEGWVQWHAWR